MQFLQSQGTAARRRVPLHLVDATDGITPETGEAAGQPQLSKNGAAFANTTATLTAIANGAYYVELTAAELDTAGFAVIRYKSANTAEAQVAIAVVPQLAEQAMASYTQPAGFLAATFPAGTVANTTNITAATGVVLSGVTHTGAVIPTVTTLTGHTPQTGDSFARIGATGSGLTSLATPTNITAGTITTVTNLTNLPAITANWLTAAGIATDAITAAKLAADASTEIAAAVNTVALVESYRANGAQGTLTQLLYEILGHLTEASIAGTTKTIKKIDHTTVAATATLDSATAPTSITRAT